MYSSLVRIQNTFGFFTTVAFVVALFIAASDFVTPRTPTVSVLKTTNLQVVRGRPHYYSTKKEEYAIIKFTLDADLSTLFTWNTKQLFVYITAEWPATSSSTGTTIPSNATANQAVIWDTIITSPSADHLSNLGPASMKKLRKNLNGRPIDPSRGKITLKNQRPKYQITHPSGKIAETDDVVLRLHYNVQPWVGILAWNQGADYGLWKQLSGAQSRKFSLPGLKKKDEPKKKTAKV